jgi:hypothetical protein
LKQIGRYKTSTLSLLRRSRRRVSGATGQRSHGSNRRRGQLERLGEIERARFARFNLGDDEIATLERPP